ncbi:DNA-binding protein [Zobellia amurskyensis]|uniref:DNA-binding protein n=1 Tax=Zobellia amurskyensis TaxID=248905 RepID=A0A7X2ZVD7_9FLAO|nr:helix-turn-helix domain-containing protein [Zobellia amurskyensis]MUH37077.1 DNA-binding protein [Zobellia amurskyensis]
MKEELLVLSKEGIEYLAKQIINHLNNFSSKEIDSEVEAFLTIEEAALLIKLSKFTIYGLVHKNKIPYHKQGKRLYFLKSELVQWIQGGTSKSSLELKADEYLFKNQI